MKWNTKAERIIAIIITIAHTFLWSPRLVYGLSAPRGKDNVVIGTGAVSGALLMPMIHPCGLRRYKEFGTRCIIAATTSEHHQHRQALRYYADRMT